MQQEILLVSLGGFVLQPEAAAEVATIPPETEDAVPKGWDSLIFVPHLPGEVC